jgi:hypothetical protein
MKNSNYDILEQQRTARFAGNIASTQALKCGWSLLPAEFQWLGLISSEIKHTLY